MKRRRERVELVDPSGVPLALVAGRCVEVWGGPDRNPFLARRAWSAARDRFLRERGLDLARPGDHPPVLRPHPVWSFARLAELDPGALAEKLADRGLPADWTPTPADPGDFPDAFPSHPKELV